MCKNLYCHRFCFYMWFQVRDRSVLFRKIPGESLEREGSQANRSCLSVLVTKDGRSLWPQHHPEGLSTTWVLGFDCISLQSYSQVTKIYKHLLRQGMWEHIDLGRVVVGGYSQAQTKQRLRMNSTSRSLRKRMESGKGMQCVIRSLNYSEQEVPI